MNSPFRGVCHGAVDDVPQAPAVFVEEVCGHGCER